VKQSVAVIGTYQTEFRSREVTKTLPEQVQEAAMGAMVDAGVNAEEIDAYVFSMAPSAFLGVGDADRWSVDYIGGAGKPMFRVHTGGATGGSAVQAADTLVRSGMFRTVMVVGAERMGDTPDAQTLLNTIVDPFYERDMALQTISIVALMTTRFMARYGTQEEDYAHVVVRQRRNALSNPYAHLKAELTIDEVMSSPMVSYPLKLADICPRSTGAAAMIVASGDVAEEKVTRPAFITGTGGVTNSVWMGDRLVPTTDAEFCFMEEHRLAADEAFRQAGIKDPSEELDLVEIYDPFSNVAHAALEAMGFCPHGTAHRFERAGAWDREGLVTVNASGGILCTNPIGVSGLVCAINAANQVMRRAETMQVPGVRRALATATGGSGQFVNVTVFDEDVVPRNHEEADY
jgi:acetyl-CoA C-acetyltransferase